MLEVDDLLEFGRLAFGGLPRLLGVEIVDGAGDQADQYRCGGCRNAADQHRVAANELPGAVAGRMRHGVDGALVKMPVQIGGQLVGTAISRLRIAGAGLRHNGLEFALAGWPDAGWRFGALASRHFAGRHPAEQCTQRPHVR